MRKLEERGSRRDVLTSVSSSKKINSAAFVELTLFLECSRNFFIASSSFSTCSASPVASQWLTPVVPSEWPLPNLSSECQTCITVWDGWDRSTVRQVSLNTDTEEESKTEKNMIHFRDGLHGPTEIFNKGLISNTTLCKLIYLSSLYCSQMLECLPIPPALISDVTLGNKRKRPEPDVVPVCVTQVAAPPYGWELNIKIKLCQICIVSMHYFASMRTELWMCILPILLMDFPSIHPSNIINAKKCM